MSNKYAVIVLAASLLSACGGGGSFVKTDQENPSPSPSSGTTKPKYSDAQGAARPAESTEALQQPGLGFSMVGTRVNKYDSKNKQSALSEKAVKRITNANKDDTQNGTWRTTDEFNQLIGNIKNADLSAVDNDDFEEHKATGYEFITLGYLLNNNRDNRFTDFSDRDNRKWFQPGIASLYYVGKDPSLRLPESQSVHYQGEWMVMTAANNALKSDDLDWYTDQSTLNGRTNSLVSADNGNHKYITDITVNFGDKTLQGAMKHQYRPGGTGDPLVDHTIYDLNAKIRGNRFIGDAKLNSAVKDSRDQLRHFATASATGTLEGGFYGDKAQELAGKFLTDDNGLFAVFGAKRESTEGEKTKTIADAVAINEADGSTEKLVNFGNAMYLNVGGKTIKLENGSTIEASLKAALTGDVKVSTDAASRVTTATKDGKEIVTVCCSNLSYTRFGRVVSDGKAALFLQGERSEQVPTAGNIKYLGTWDGFISAQSNFTQQASMQANKGKAEFDVDFGKKTLKGGLYRENGAVEGVHIEGGFTGNEFTTVKASTSANGFSLDPENITSGKSVTFNDVEVKGGFYGPNALEMGGSISHTKFAGDNSKLGIVFGARKQVETN